VRARIARIRIIPVVSHVVIERVCARGIAARAVGRGDWTILWAPSGIHNVRHDDDFFPDKDRLSKGRKCLWILTWRKSGKKKC